LPGPDLDLHHGDDIIQVLDHLLRLLGIDGMSMGFVLLCVQGIKLAPGESVCQIAVVGNEKPTA